MCVEISDSSLLPYTMYLYGLPGQPANFFEEYQDLLENFATLHSEFNCFFNFNLHLDKRTSVTITFDGIITSFDLK